MNQANTNSAIPSWDEIRQMIHETSIQMKETDRRMKESDLKFEKMREELKELSTRFTSQSGHIIEGLMEPSAIKISRNVVTTSIAAGKISRNTTSRWDENLKWICYFSTMIPLLSSK